MRKLKYMIIEAPNLSRLEEAVSHHIDTGWRCCGNPNYYQKFTIFHIFGKMSWYQAMTYVMERRKNPLTDLNIMSSRSVLENSIPQPAQSPTLN